MDQDGIGQADVERPSPYTSRHAAKRSVESANSYACVIAKSFGISEFAAADSLSGKRVEG